MAIQWEGTVAMRSIGRREWGGDTRPPSNAFTNPDISLLFCAGVKGGRRPPLSTGERVCSLFSQSTPSCALMTRRMLMSAQRARNCIGQSAMKSSSFAPRCGVFTSARPPSPHRQTRSSRGRHGFSYSSSSSSNKTSVAEIEEFNPAHLFFLNGVLECLRCNEKDREVAQSE